jgi:hypothetical protein
MEPGWCQFTFCNPEFAAAPPIAANGGVLAYHSTSIDMHTGREEIRCLGYAVAYFGPDNAPITPMLEIRI